MFSLVKDNRKSRTSSWDILAKSRLPNRAENLERMNSQVLIVFFFGVGPVVLKVEIDGLRNFHGAPLIAGVVGKRNRQSCPVYYLQPFLHQQISYNYDGGMVVCRPKMAHGKKETLQGRRFRLFS